MEKNFEDEAKAIAVKVGPFRPFPLYGKEVWNVSGTPLTIQMLVVFSTGSAQTMSLGIMKIPTPGEVKGLAALSFRRHELYWKQFLAESGFV